MTVPVSRAAQASRIEPSGFSITAHGNSDPGSIEQGGHTLSLIGGTAPQMWLAMDEAEYRLQKEKVSRELLAMAIIFGGVGIVKKYSKK